MKKLITYIIFLILFDYMLGGILLLFLLSGGQSTAFFPPLLNFEEYSSDCIDELFGFYIYLTSTKNLSFFFVIVVLKTLFFHKWNISYNLNFDFIQPRGFQTPESSNMFALISTHNLIFSYCIFIFIFVTIFLAITLYYFGLKANVKKSIFKNVENCILLYEKAILRVYEEQNVEPYLYILNADNNDFIVQFQPKKGYFLYRLFNYTKFVNESVVANVHMPESERKKILFRLKNILYTQVPELKTSEIGENQILKESRKARKKGKLNEQLFNFISSEMEYLIEKKRTIILSNRARKKVWDNLLVEFIWTLIPTVILVFIAIPSFTLLYGLQPTLLFDANTVFVKIIGHQWYWSYEFPLESFNLLQKTENLPSNFDASFTSYMLPVSELTSTMPRLLSVDNPLYLPINTNIVIRVTSEDVIHSWAVPALGIKLDCIPGRINEFVFKIQSAGNLYGQCSELCGVNHGFMPIHIVSYNPN